MKSLILATLLFGSNWVLAKPFIQSIEISPKKKYEMQEKMKDSNLFLNYKITLVLKKPNDILKVNKKLKDLKIESHFYPDYLKKEVFQAQVICSKKDFGKLMKYLSSQKIKVSTK